VRDQLKLIGFAAAVCLVCSVLLAFVSSALSERQDRNRANDIRIKVLQVFGEPVTDEKGKLNVTQAELDALFSERISGVVLDSQGRPVADRKVDKLTSEEISDRDKATGLKAFYPVYVHRDPDSGRTRYAIHVSGKGLWSTIKGYMALEDDLSTIAGIVFYEHQETPGLGGEVEKPYFQDRFKGKSWLANGVVQTFRVVKPGAEVDSHAVDGITAATMTGRGLERFLNEDFAVYNKYLETKRMGE